MNYKIVIIGAGQIGSRHLQGLTKSSKNFQVFVVDIDKKALRIAKKRYIEASKKKIDNNVSYHQSLSEIPDNLDFAIIATTANVRRSVIEKLLTKKTVRYLLFEKIVFQNSEDFLPIQCLLNDQGNKAWVNCTRRSYSYYKKLKKEINKTKSKAYGYIKRFSWLVERSIYDSTQTIPSDVTTYVTNVRTACDVICTAIENATTMDEFKVLFDNIYNKDKDGFKVATINNWPDDYNVRKYIR